MATVQDLIDRATERSNLNDVSLIGSAELISWVAAGERLLFLEISKENPWYYATTGNTAARASNTDAWNPYSAPGANYRGLLKATVAAITGTVSGVSVGDTVNIVSLRDPSTMPGPRIYQSGGNLYDYNSELSTDSSNYVTTLTLTYIWVPTTPTATTDNLGGRVEFLDFIESYVAMRIALRDQRPEDAASLEKDMQVALQVARGMAHLADTGAVIEPARLTAANQ